MLAQEVEHLTVVLQQFQRQVTRRMVRGDVLVGLQVLLYFTDTVLNLMTIVNVDMASVGIGILIDLDDHAKEILDTHAALERRGHHRHTKEGAQCRQVYLVATTFKLVVHIQGAHQTEVHVDKLRRQIEVAFQVRGVDDVDDHIRHLFRQVLTHV